MIKISREFYSEEEVVRMFKNAHIKQNRIMLIQELTLLKKSRVVDILNKHGCELLPTDLTREAKKEVMEEILLEMYYNGRSDFAIAKRLGVSETTANSLRRNMGLKPNGGKKVKKEPADTGK